MSLHNRFFFAFIVAAVLMFGGFSLAQGAAGWNNNGDIEHASVTQNVAGDIHVLGKIDGGSHVNLTSSGGSITIDGKIDGGSSAILNAAGDIRIGVAGGGGNEKIDGQSMVSAFSGGTITLGNKIDGGPTGPGSQVATAFHGRPFTVVFFRAQNGIDVGDKIDGGVFVALCTASGRIHVQGKIDNSGTKVYYWPSGSLVVDGGIQRGTVQADHQKACGGLGAVGFTGMPSFSLTNMAPSGSRATHGGSSTSGGGASTTPATSQP